MPNSTDPKRHLLIFLTALLMAGCNNRPVSIDELRKYPFDPSHGLIQASNSGETEMEVYYKPMELVLNQELQANLDARAVAEVRKDVDSLDYFVLRLSRKGQEIENGFAHDPAVFNKVIDNLSFSIGRDIYMIHKKDTLPVLDFSYARMFGTTDASNILIVFKSNLKTKEGKVKICFDDTLLDTGLSVYEFDLDDIKNIPPLN